MGNENLQSRIVHIYAFFLLKIENDSEKKNTIIVKKVKTCKFFFIVK